MKLNVRYFAWMRERVGAAQEDIETDAVTVAELIDDLRSRSEGHAMAFSDPGAIRAAVDQDLVEFSAPIADAREVAFFPPMTGG